MSLPIEPTDFNPPSLSGPIVVSNRHANITIHPSYLGFTGDKTYTVKIRKYGIDGPVVAYATATLSDISSIVSITPNVTTFNEGGIVTFDVVAQNAGNANVYFSVLPSLGNVTFQDFTANTGSFFMTSNVGTFSIRANLDASTTVEQPEVFKMQIRRGTATGDVAYTTANITLNDTSNAYISYMVASPNSVYRGNSVTISIYTVNVPTGTTLYYNTIGNVVSTNFITGNTGSIVINNNSNTITLQSNLQTIPNFETRYFSLQIITSADFAVSNIIGTSDRINITDWANLYYIASGGTKVIGSDGYTYHTFTTSNNLTFTNLAPSQVNDVQMLIVGGGGAGGASTTVFPGNYKHGSGGGAGLVAYVNKIPGSVFTAGGSVANIIVGAGGPAGISSVYFDDGIGEGNRKGSFSNVSIGATKFIAAGGGGGTHATWDPSPAYGNYVGSNYSSGTTGYPGGSGGGGSTWRVEPAGTPTPGTRYGGVTTKASGDGSNLYYVTNYGNPGGAFNVTPATTSASTSGGGGAGAIGGNNSTTIGGAGGVGVQFTDWASQTGTGYDGGYYGGGGGGAGAVASDPTGANRGIGGFGGGGHSGLYGPGVVPGGGFGGGLILSPAPRGFDANVNSGGGGGGSGAIIHNPAGRAEAEGGAGGSGIVIVRYTTRK
jgi:hypothetical protein